MDLHVTAANRLYTCAEDLISTYLLLFAGRVRDALTGETLRAPFLVSTSRPDLFARTLSKGSGLFAVATDAELAFPRLATDAYDFDLHITSPRYRGVDIPIHVPSGTIFPLPALDVELYRTPIRLQGRVVRAATNHDPIPSARITIQEAEVLPFATTFSFPHAAGTEVRAVNLSPAGGVKQLTAQASAGQRTLVLSNRSGLTVGDLLRLGPPHGLELAIIESLAPQPADPLQPGEVTLRTPLRRTLAAGDEAIELTPAPDAGSSTLARDLEPGEGVAVLAGALTASAVRVEAAASPIVEYHIVGVETDPDGYYRLDGIGAISEATFVAAATGFTTGVKSWILDFSVAANVLDFRLETP